MSGLSVGRISDTHLEGTKVRVDFTVDKNVELGDRKRHAISWLGSHLPPSMVSMKWRSMESPGLSATL